MNKFCYIVRGLPGSGKSALASKLQFQLKDRSGKNPGYCSTDDIWMSGTYYCWIPDFISVAHKINLAKFKKIIDNNLHVIVDNTNITWKEIVPYATYAVKNKYMVYITEPKTEWKFDVKICAEKNTHGVPIESIQKMKDKWESTTSIEQKLIALQSHYNYLHTY